VEDRTVLQSCWQHNY